MNISGVEQSPPLTPYPNWEVRTIDKALVDGVLADNSTIISTWRVYVDECDRLWVMDTGLANITGTREPFVPPALAIFDLETDRLIRRYTFSSSDVQANVLLANVVCISYSNSMVVFPKDYLIKKCLFYDIFEKKRYSHKNIFKCTLYWFLLHL